MAIEVIILMMFLCGENCGAYNYENLSLLVVQLPELCTNLTGVSPMGTRFQSL